MKEGYFEHSMSLSKLTLSGRERWDVVANVDNVTKFAVFFLGEAIWRNTGPDLAVALWLRLPKKWPSLFYKAFLYQEEM